MSADRRSHPATGDPMNLPNYITLVRIILIPFFVNLMIYGYFRAALLVFAVACVTDALDGLIARLTGQITELGAFLDPMADKLLIISAFVTLVLKSMLPVWLVIVPIVLAPLPFLVRPSTDMRGTEAVDASGRVQLGFMFIANITVFVWLIANSLV